jgi:hypothetical protein
MKNLLYLSIGVLLVSCSLQKNKNSDSAFTPKVSIENKLTDTESNVINDFIDVELKKERYKNYKDFEVIVIKEALKKDQCIEAYQYSRDEWISMERVNKIGDIENRYFLDDLQVKKIKRNLEKEEIYHWKVTDFNIRKVRVLPYEELRTIINTGSYGNSTRQIIIYLSRPLIIDKNNAFVSFEVGNGQLGFNSINHFTILMRKINNKWEQRYNYYDGVFN